MVDETQDLTISDLFMQCKVNRLLKARRSCWVHSCSAKEVMRRTVRCQLLFLEDI